MAIAESEKVSDVVVDLPLGDSGEKLTWAEFYSACKWACQLESELRRYEHGSSSFLEQENWRKRIGIPREYRDYLIGPIWGPLSISPELIRNCFKEGLIGVGSHIAMSVMLAIRDCGQNDSSALIQGETGTGKEIVARCIHYQSNRKGGPFVALNCAGLPSELLESELFGYEAGAFTGGLKKGKEGLVATADGGTLFLDEIGDMSFYLQAKILRVLNDGTFIKVGGIKQQKVNARIIAATNRDLEAAMEKEVFRRDLYYRLNTMEINLRPLYLRPGDLPLLIYYFVKRYNKKHGTSINFVTQGLLDEALLYRWRGNIRELQSLVDRACNVARNQTQNTDTLAGFDVLYKVPERGLGPGASSIPELDFLKKIDIEKLRVFNTQKFMANIDKGLTQEYKGLGNYSYRLRVLANERQGIAPPPDRDPIESIYNRSFEVVKRDYAQWMVKRYGNPYAASQVAGITSKTLAKWAKGE